MMIGCSPANQATLDPAEVLAREQQRVSYLTSGSYDQLSDMMSETMSYTHSNGLIENKAEFMEVLNSGRVVYRNIQHQELEVRIINPTTAIINGISDVSVTVSGEEVEVPLRFTIVYSLVGSELLFEAWHSARRPIP